VRNTSREASRSRQCAEDPVACACDTAPHSQTFALGFDLKFMYLRCRVRLHSPHDARHGLPRQK